MRRALLVLLALATLGARGGPGQPVVEPQVHRPAIAGAQFYGGTSSTRTTQHWAGRVTSSSETTANLFWWETTQRLGICHGRYTADTAPDNGAGTQSWAVSLNYNENATAAGQSCNSDLTPYVSSGTLCTISETEHSCEFTIDLATLNTHLGAAANSCLQFQIDPSGTPAGTAGDTVALDCELSTPTSLVRFSGGAADDLTTTAYCGPESCATTPSTLTHFVAPIALDACALYFDVNTVPGGSGEWDVDVEVSTTALGATQVPTDLTYTTVTMGCVITAAQRRCSVPLMAMTVPAGGLVRIKPTEAVAAANTLGEHFALDCRPVANSVYVAGAGTVSGTAATIAGPNTNDFARTGSIASSNNEGTRAIVPYDLGSCDGMIAMDTAAAGSWAVVMSYSTAAMTTSQDCNDLTYTATGTLCTIATGQKTCRFANALVPALKNGCYALEAIETGASATGTTTWAYTCTRAP